MSDDVGPRLVEIRRRHGLSQRALARKCGVTNATISLIESGAVSPSVGSLKRILDGIPIGLAEFFGFPLDDQERVFFTADQLVEIGEGGVSFRQILPDLKGRALQILHEHYQPGTDTGKVLLTHEGQEGGVVIRGRLEVQVGSVKRVLGPGDAYYFESSKPHRFRNVGDEVCEVVSACTPPSF
ncbi:aldehyde dehydrogenase [Aliidongia dinghuensis]|uniref:Aldehyde dehydrogenase n=1 Tax=Aliidongia dinghuensis TaxID=1867774 RepID=A0A8J2YWQ1_9PROT|nr:cupin domain-containing protein [Aliidongia dinghuensis]GGF30365.1 aldehyde dehydrogenase [Aliidongia dinghuensis]